MGDLERLRRKSVAVGSGKGGVGKSTTAVNLAIVAAKSGRRVALVDLDPLSNVATILDVEQGRIEKVAERVAKAKGALSAYTLPLFPRIDLLFPRPKLGREEGAKLRSILYQRSTSEALDRYDLIICDMPAGIGHDENLGFLPFVAYLIVVTNPEPTSHVSAGGYIRVALEIQPDLDILLWHNKYREVLPGGFRPTEVVSNYNRYVDDELKITPAANERIAHLARVPDDPSLNLLQQSLSSEIQILAKLLDTTQMLKRAVIAGLDAGTIVEKRIVEEFRYFLSTYSGPLTVDAIVAEAHNYLEFDEEVAGGTALVQRFLVHPLVKPIQTAVAEIKSAIEALVNRNRLWQSGDDGRLIKRSRSSVRRLISQIPNIQPEKFILNLGGLLVCYLALLMITDSERIRSLISDAIPIRQRNGRRVRDRRLLIRNLVVRNDEYHRKYFELVKTLYPVLIRQIDRMVSAARWQPLLLRSEDGEVNRNSYLKLLTHTLHDVLHAGLGVYVGFRYNTAGKAIEEGATRLLSIVAPSKNRPST